MKREIKRSKKGIHIVSIVTISLIVQIAAVEAAPVVSTTIFNNGFGASAYNLITDSNGKEWLSLQATDGMSYSVVDNNINSQVGDFGDYRFATKAEVLALFQEYGAPDIDAGQTAANVPFANAFQNDFGITGGNIGQTRTWGYTSDILPGFPSFHVTPFVNLDLGGGVNPKASFRTDLKVDIFFGANAFERGSWLIRNNVAAAPVPAAVWLFGSGLLGLVGVARRRTDRS